MSLIYGYNNENGDNSDKDKNVSDLKKLVGKKTDDRSTDSAFGRIKNNKKNISSSIVSTANVIASVVSSLGQKTDDKDVDSAFGKIKKNKKDIQTSNTLVGSSSSVEGESTLKGTQLSHASAISAHSSNLLELETNLGAKTDDKTKDSAFGKIEKNKEDIQTSNGLVGSKTDDKNADSAFGRIQKNKENIEKLRYAVELKETTGTFVAPLDDGKVEITGWTMTRYSTIIAITIKAKQSLLGASRATLYSGTSSVNNNHTMTVPMSLADMKLGKPAVIIHTKDPGHARMYANTRGNAIGSVGDRTVEVKFIYIDHTTPNLN